MTRLTLPPGGFLFLAAAACLSLVAAHAGDPPKALPKNPSTTNVLDYLHGLAPAERMRFLEKLPAEERPLVTVKRGAVTQMIVERGTLQAVKSTVINCTVKATKKGSTVAAIIKWVVEDGTWVKKGDKLIEFDNAELLDRAKDRKARIAKADADLVKAIAHLAEIERENAIDIKLAEVEVKLADLARREYKGNDAIQKDILALKVDRQVLLLERLKSTARAKTALGAAERDAKKAIRDQELARLRDLEGEGAKHIVHAPHDGFVVYYVPEQSRLGGGGQSLVAQGEPVREGQKLLVVADLKQMAVVTRIHEAVISKVRAGQKATVRVDAFPGKVETGKVTDVATVADQASFFSKDIKVYQVVIAIDGDNKTMKPGMSATVEVTLGEKADCIRIPATGIVSLGKNSGCYVASGNELQLRGVKFGVADVNFVEVIDGVKEGELVLGNPRAVAARLAEMHGGGKQPEKGKGKGPPK
jgi:multidrug resistance efflux pump